MQRSRFLRRSVHAGMPVKIGIEPTTSCNLRCPECPSGLRSFTRPTGMLNMDLFRKVTDEIHKDLVYMLFYFQGEPFLNPLFLEMVNYASLKKIFTATSTNGHFLNDDTAKKTVESGLHEITFSIDGLTQETYEKYRIGGSLSKVESGIQNILKWKTELRSRTPLVIVQFIVFLHNESEKEKVNAYGYALGADKVVLKTAQVYDFKDGNSLIPTDSSYSRYENTGDGKWRIKNSLKNKCWKMWLGAEITWDGKVLPCCFDKDGQYEMGNVTNQTFGMIWKGDSYKSFRNKLLDSRKEIEMCTNCTEGTKVWAG